MSSSKLPTERADSASGAILWTLRTSIAALFVTLCVTGVLLMAAYNPSTATAWGSVWFIQTRTPFGWLIRGVHFFASDAMIALSFLYVLSLVATRAYRGSGGGVVWAIAMVVTILALSASLTGHLLPWDQAGYWGTVVRSNILARTPIAGDILRRFLLGGSNPGNSTIARFFALHTVLFPLFLSPIVLWLPVFRDRRGDATLRVMSKRRNAFPLARVTICVAVLVAIGVHYISKPSLLTAPADPGASDFPARPEWHTLFLFQWLKLFEGPMAEMVGSVLIPGIIAVLLLLLPLTEVVFPKVLGRRVAVAFVGTLLVAVCGFTVGAVVADKKPTEAEIQRVAAIRKRGDPLSPIDESILRAQQFHEQRRRARASAARAVELANEYGIPPEGPLALLANDPFTRGPQLFAANCAACHRFNGHDGMGAVRNEPATSSDLGGFASRKWIRGLLANPESDHYFGLMKKPNGQPAHTKMVRWLRSFRAENEENPDEAEVDLDAVAMYLESESLRPGRFADIDAYTDLTDDPSTGVERTLREGRLFFMQTCNECHTYNGENEGTTRAPEFFGYGSVDWIALMIAQPDHKTRYRKSGKEPAQMPEFAGKLSEKEISLIARWIHDSRSTDLESGS